MENVLVTKNGSPFELSGISSKDLYKEVKKYFNKEKNSIFCQGASMVLLDNLVGKF